MQRRLKRCFELAEPGRADRQRFKRGKIRFKHMAHHGQIVWQPAQAAPHLQQGGKMAARATLRQGRWIDPIQPGRFSRTDQVREPPFDNRAHLSRLRSEAVCPRRTGGAQGGLPIRVREAGRQEGLGQQVGAKPPPGAGFGMSGCQGRPVEGHGGPQVHFAGMRLITGSIHRLVRGTMKIPP